MDTRIDDMQRSNSPKSKMASSYRSRCMCCVLETNLMRKFAVDLSLQIFLIHYIYLGKVMMKHSSRQFGNQFSGFGHQSEKFSHIGTCIRRNFTPWGCSKIKVVSQHPWSKFIHHFSHLNYFFCICVYV